MLRTFAALVWWAPSAPEGRGGWGSGLDKHGFPLAGAPAPGGFGVADLKDHAYQICCPGGGVVREARGMGAGRWASISRGEYHQ